MVDEVEVAVEVGTGVEVVVTGHTVVETGMIEVTTTVEFLGQLVTVGAQLMMVLNEVE